MIPFCFQQHILHRQPVEKCYFLSVSRVSYGREAVLPHNNERPVDTPTHRLVVHGLKGAWTKSNRDVAFALFDTFVKTKVRVIYIPEYFLKLITPVSFITFHFLKQLKKNLSTEALKGFRSENTTTPLKSRGRPSDGQLTPPTNPSLQVRTINNLLASLHVIILCYISFTISVSLLSSSST